MFVRFGPPFIHVMHHKSFARQAPLFYSIFQVDFESLLGLERLPSQVEISEHYDAEVVWMNEYRFLPSIFMEQLDNVARVGTKVFVIKRSSHWSNYRSHVVFEKITYRVPAWNMSRNNVSTIRSGEDDGFFYRVVLY
ncbi:protein of unknown function [Burkholderia multivorans]